MIDIAGVECDKGKTEVNGCIVKIVGQEWETPPLISPPNELSIHFSKVPIFNLLLLSSLIHHIRVCFFHFPSSLPPPPSFPSFLLHLLLTYVLFVNVCSWYQISN